MTSLTRHRSHRAQCLLETTNTPVEQIGPLVGFPSPTTFRWSAPQSPDYEPTKMGIWRGMGYVEETQEFYSGV